MQTNYNTGVHYMGANRNQFYIWISSEAISMTWCKNYVAYKTELREIHRRARAEQKHLDSFLNDHAVTQMTEYVVMPETDTPECIVLTNNGWEKFFLPKVKH